MDVATPGSKTVGNIPLTGHTPEAVTQEEKGIWGAAAVFGTPLECLSLQEWIHKLQGILQWSAVSSLR